MSAERSIAAKVMLPGFVDPPRDSQAVFRRILEAMAQPGHVLAIPCSLDAPPPLDVATAAACLALLDYETPVWLQPHPGMQRAEAYLRFHCGCPVVTAPEDAHFAVVVDARTAPALTEFAQGTPEEPHKSATVLLQLGDLVTGPAKTLRGPGIADTATLSPLGLPAAFWQQWRANHAAFPLGVDLILTSCERLAALPRTTAVEG
jgi:alpha-D-ribose 1-methylphosphonate 5-triphosphate synthase subunit PhnH